MQIVVVDGATVVGNELSWEPLGELGDLSVFPRTSAADVVERCRDADIIVTNKVVFHNQVLRELDQLKLVAVSATGFNNVDIDVATQREVTVCNVPAYSSEAVAQHVFAMLLAVIHQPESHSQAVHQGDWIRSSDFSFWIRPLSELAGKTLGIIGYGQIGRAVAKIAYAFGMDVLVSTRTRRDTDGDTVRYVAREMIFELSDFVTLHCPETPETRGMIDRSVLAKMKPTAVLVNTARGGLVNEMDLAEALQSGEIARACLDVVAEEPMSPTSPLLGLPNCLITPHIAWSAVEARARCLRVTIENVANYLGGTPRNVVNRR